MNACLNTDVSLHGENAECIIFPWKSTEFRAQNPQDFLLCLIRDIVMMDELLFEGALLPTIVSIASAVAKGGHQVSIAHSRKQRIAERFVVARTACDVFESWAQWARGQFRIKRLSGVG